MGFVVEGVTLEILSPCAVETAQGCMNRGTLEHANHPCLELMLLVVLLSSSYLLSLRQLQQLQRLEEYLLGLLTWGSWHSMWPWRLGVLGLVVWNGCTRSSIC